MPSSFLSLEKLPDSSGIHLWADYLELRCLTNSDLAVSKSDLQTYVRKRSDLRKGLEDYGDELGPETGLNKLPIDIKKAAQAEDLFKHLGYRASAFADFYPFTLSNHGDILLRRPHLTKKHKLYLFFLLSSNLKHISDKRHRNRFTDAFEIASLVALKGYLPQTAEVYLFGTNSLKKKKERYAVLLLERIKRLAADLKEDFIGDESDFAANNNGDNGLDVVGWIPMGDDVGGFIIVFGQCSCSDEEWPKKQASSSPAHWRKTIKFLAPPNNMIFIPFCYRRDKGEWHREITIDDTIVIDRLRLVKLLETSYHSLKNLPFELINRALDQRELWM